MKLLKLLSVLLLALCLMACGGSSGGGTTPDDNPDPGPVVVDPDPDPDPTQGRFENVTGLIYYTNETDNGVTENGYFDYEDGETVGLWLNYFYNVFIGYALAGDGMTIEGLAIDGEWISEETAGNIRLFLEAIDFDGDPSNGITITDDQRSRIREKIEFRLPRHRFILQYADYAEYIAGSTAATGDIGQSADPTIVLSVGTAIYLPINTHHASTLVPDINMSDIMNMSVIYDYPPIKTGIYVMGASSGTENVRISQDGYDIEFTVQVVDPAGFDNFTGTTIDFFNPEPNVTENVDYSDFLVTVEALGVVDPEALIYQTMIFKTGDY